MEELISQSKEKKVAGLEAILQSLEGHLKSSRAYFARHPQATDTASLLEHYQQAYDEALALKERAQAGDDDEERWFEFQETYESLSRSLARIGTRNWLDIGPTSSRRVNQLLFFCDRQRAIKAKRERNNLCTELQFLIVKFLKEVEDGPLQDGLKTVKACLGKILDNESPNFAPLASKLLQTIESLGELMDLAVLDQQVGPEKSWLENFRHLAEAVLLGEVEPDYLFRERDLAVERINAMLPVTFAADAPDELPEILVDLSDHLALLEQTFDNDEEFQEWDAELGELWEELEEVNRETQASPTNNCAVCGGSLPEGAERCPLCKAPILALDQAQMQEAPPEASTTGSVLLDKLLDAWEDYSAGSLSEEALRKQFSAVERKVKGALKASARAPADQAPAPAVSRSLQRFATQIEAFCDAGAAELPSRWANVRSAGEELIGNMMANG